MTIKCGLRSLGKNVGGGKKKKNSSSVALEEASESLPSCPEVLEYVEYVFLEVFKTVL